MRNLVSKQRLPKSSTSTSTRAKLTLPQYVVPNRDNLFPPELQNTGKAKLNMFLEVPNEGSLPFVVTASLHKLWKEGGTGVRVVLLESGWMPVAGELQLEEGDTVSIFLLNKTPWTYSIEVERVREADQIDEDVVPEEAPTRMIPDLNVPVPDMENNLNQQNQSERMMLDFDLNGPPPPDM